MTMVIKTHTHKYYVIRPEIPEQKQTMTNQPGKQRTLLLTQTGTAPAAPLWEIRKMLTFIIFSQSLLPQSIPYAWSFDMYS
jgi:hypothetical protein